METLAIRSAPGQETAASREMPITQSKASLHGDVDDASVESKSARNQANKRRWRMEFVRAQSYLGLAAKPSTASLDGTDSMPGSQAKRFICIDIEAFEFNQNLITEIGISTLQTTDIPLALPQPNWPTQIDSRHLRIRENLHRVNKRHVAGCPDKFNFGVSDVIALRDVVAELTAVFRPSQNTGKPILVGHNIISDVKYMAQLGFDVTPFISDCLDTEDLSRVSERHPGSKSLGKLLDKYKIKAENLHNAGNDARYTLELMLAMLCYESSHKPSRKEWHNRKEVAIKKAIVEAERRARELLDGWTSEEGEDAFAEEFLDEPAKLPQSTIEQSAQASTTSSANLNSTTPSWHGPSSKGRGGRGESHNKSSPRTARRQQPADPEAARQDFVARAGRHRIHAGDAPPNFGLPQQHQGARGRGVGLSEFIRGEDLSTIRGNRAARRAQAQAPAAATILY